MVFSSLSFLVFFLPVTLAAYYCVPSLRLKNVVLLAMSCLFYAWGEPRYIFLILASVCVNYLFGLAVANMSFSARKRKLLLALDVSFNLGILFVFKYANFALRLLHVNFTTSLVMPIGISFYTFQILSYIIDTYRNPLFVQKNILSLALYIMFFPQMIAGPIVRYHDVNLQIERRAFNLSQFYRGCQRFAIGLAKKVLIANNLARVCDSIFSLRFDNYGTGWAWLALSSYMLQIYYDFSGYSDMAIGLGKMFGFDFLENFNFPYSAGSIKELWQRWHISLSSWFRDYVYFPLGGNRRGRLRTIFNKYAVFFLTGLWHGASLSFILWGLGNGTLSVLEDFVARLKIREGLFVRIAKHVYTVLSFTLLGAFFRTSTKTGIQLVLKLFGINYTRFYGTFTAINENPLLPIYMDGLFLAAFVAAVVFSFKWWGKIRVPEIVKNVALIILVVLSFASLARASYNPFIYFRF